jgi:hypothetical protein
LKFVGGENVMEIIEAENTVRTAKKASNILICPFLLNITIEAPQILW